MDFIQTSNKQVDKFGPGKHGFSAGNPAGGVQATYFSPEWADALQQELINVIEAAGIAPSGASLAQLLLALRSAGVFQTPASFDDGTKAATTAFVRRALGNTPGDPVAVAVNTAILAANAGKLHVVSGSPTITLPAIGAATYGIAFSFLARSAFTLTAGADTIFRGLTSGTSFVIPVGETVTVVQGSSGWYLASAGFGSDSFVSSISNPGYQKLPGGLILQWGAASSSATARVTVTLPIAFPTAKYGAFLIVRDGTSDVPYFASVFDTGNLANIAINGWLHDGSRVSIVVDWFVLGK